MTEGKVYPVPAERARRAWIDAAKYEAMYAASIRDPEAFWREQAKRLDWSTPFKQVKDVSFDVKDFRVRWFADGRLNVAANCLDRHLAKRASQTAILWEPDDPNEGRASFELRRASRAGLPHGECAEEARRR